MNGSIFEKQCFADYKENPSETNYLRILDHVRNQPGIIDYYGTMKEDSTKRSMPDFFIFSCYAK